jgi:hypothetical protein
MEGPFKSPGPFGIEYYKCESCGETEPRGLNK